MQIRETAQGVTDIPISEWFDLEVGYDTNGLQLSVGTRALRVKLVQLGPVRSFEEARKKAKKGGYRLVGGQAREPLKELGCTLPVMFGESDANAACLNAFPDGWKSSSNQPGVVVFGGHWWWLVTKKN